MSSLAAQKAIVSVEKAVVYSDSSLDVPLGYVKRGQKIIVGDVKKRHNKIIAVALIGRIGWIHVEDIQIQREN